MPSLTIVFDLDGTLVDTAPDLIAATNHVLAKLGLATVDHNLIRPAISFGAREMINQGLKAHGKQLRQPQLDELFADFLDYYANNIAEFSKPFPGIINVLEHYRQAGARLAVCTNKREDLSRRLLDSLDLSPYFSAIAGRDTFEVFKPDPGHLTKTITLAGGTAQSAIMVGDSHTDVATAKAANIPVIGVTFGYSDRPMRELQPSAIIDAYCELQSAVTDLLNSDILDTE